MTDRDAIIRLREHTQYYVPVEDLSALELAIDALQEREKRARGCKYCNIEANKNAMVEDHGYAVCPYCGKPLKGADNER